MPHFLSPSAARHLPLVIRCQLLSQNSPPKQVDCRRHHRPLSLHCLPPRRLTHCIVRHPHSARQHRCRRHCCGPLLIPTALIALSALSARRSHYCRDPLLAPTALVTLSTTRSRRVVPPPSQQHRPHRCHRDFLMQKLQDTDVNVNIGINVVCLALLLPTLAAAFVVVVLVSAL